MSDFAARTNSMTSRTTGFVGITHRAPSRDALAARSLAAVDRIKDPEKRFEAFSRHMEMYPPLLGRQRHEPHYSRG